MILHRLLRLTMRAKIMIKLIALIIGFLMVIFEVSVEYYAEPDKEVKPKIKYLLLICGWGLMLFANVL